MIQQGIQKLLAGHDLRRAEMAEAMNEIADGGATPAQVGAFLVALRMRRHLRFGVLSTVRRRLRLWRRRRRTAPSPARFGGVRSG